MEPRGGAGPRTCCGSWEGLFQAPGGPGLAAPGLVERLAAARLKRALQPRLTCQYSSHQFYASSTIWRGQSRSMRT